MTSTPTKRQKLQDLMAQMQEDQNAAVEELLAILDSDPVQDFLNGIKLLRERTIPGQFADLNIGYIETVFSGVRSTLMANRPPMNPVPPMVS